MEENGVIDFGEIEDKSKNIIKVIGVALCIFMMLKGINKLNRKKEEPAPEPEAPKGPTQEELLAEIRDLLKNK